MSLVQITALMEPPGQQMAMLLGEIQHRRPALPLQSMLTKQAASGKREEKGEDLEGDAGHSSKRAHTLNGNSVHLP